MHRIGRVNGQLYGVRTERSYFIGIYPSYIELFGGKVDKYFHLFLLVLQSGMAYMVCNTLVFF